MVANQIFGLLTVMLFLLLNACTPQPTEGVNQDAKITPVQREMMLATLDSLPQGAELSLAIIDDGSIRFGGYRNNSRTPKEVQNQTVLFEIGSITKVFTGSIFAGMIQEAKVSLNQNLSSILGLNTNLPITLKELATHTSGMPRVPPALAEVSLENPYRDFDSLSLVKYLQDELVLDTVPGVVSAYSNLGMGTLGFALSRVEEKPFMDLLEYYVFKPCEMHHSGVEHEHAQSLVIGINDAGDPVSQWDMGALQGAGAVISSALEMAQFASAQFVPDYTHFELARTPHFTVSEQFSCGLGWGLVQVDEHLWHWHNGGTGGYTSSLIVDVDRKKAVVLLSNISALESLSTKITSLAAEMMHTL
ncbi:MAG: beta-lactamase family protein [Saprospiraceae bacterium]|nr:beta-lactamase family protein [Saprospiraceae bacterium]